MLREKLYRWSDSSIVQQFNKLIVLGNHIERKNEIIYVLYISVHWIYNDINEKDCVWNIIMSPQEVRHFLLLS